MKAGRSLRAIALATVVTIAIVTAVFAAKPDLLERRPGPPTAETLAALKALVTTEGPGAFTDEDLDLLNSFTLVDPGLLQALASDGIRVYIVGEGDSLDTLLLIHPTNADRLEVLRTHLEQDRVAIGKLAEQDFTQVSVVTEARFGSSVVQGQTLKELAAKQGWKSKEEVAVFCDLVKTVNGDGLKLNQDNPALTPLEGRVSLPRIVLRHTPGGQDLFVEPTDWERGLASWCDEDGWVDPKAEIRGSFYVDHKVIIFHRQAMRTGDQSLFPLHELAHAVDKVYKDLAPDRHSDFFERLLKAYFAVPGDWNRWAISGSSRENYADYFAEGFTIYHSNPLRLRTLDSALYQLVNEAVLAVNPGG